jgi:peptidoglycan/xylan/chitin deacetylase (PgdA/CDA1 family)
MKPVAIRKQINSTRAAIASAAQTDSVLFRPPYGDINHTVWDQARITGVKVVLWDQDTLDWSKPGPDKIVRNALRGIGRTSIVLMHDGGGDRSQTIAALPEVIRQLKARGYTFVTVGELQGGR